MMPERYVIAEPAQAETPTAAAGVASAKFHSILFERPDDRPRDGALAAPSFFTDLNCDQIVAAVTTGREEYDLAPFFHSCLHRVDAIHYRHEVMRDLENADVHTRIDAFALAMRDVRGYLARARQLHYKEQRQAWFLDAVEVYCRSVDSLARDLWHLKLGSRGFIAFRDYLTAYAASPRFSSLSAQAQNLKSGLSAVDYCIHIRTNGFTVRPYRHEADYSAEVEATFDKFKQGAAKDYRVKFNTGDDINHVEAKILEFVAKLNSELFASLDRFCAEHADFIDRPVAVFDREVQFYVAYLEHITPLRQAGLAFSYPRVSDRRMDVYANGSFDIALAHKLVGEAASVVCNDFHLGGSERVLVVSGPNQGGKTTYARAFGQIHYLASVGCPVPGADAQLLLFDEIFTHFEKEEKVENLRGKLEDDLLRIRDILGKATARSIIVLNEVFTSTTVHDETFLSKKIMSGIVALGAVCVWVTFVDELASFSPQTVSMVATVAPDNPALRTFRIVPRPADGLAYAMAIARKYGLTYDLIRERVRL
jgi:DNA mismatch repair protein MutS